MGIEGFVLFALCCAMFGAIGYKQGREDGFKIAERESRERLRKKAALERKEGE